MVGDRVIRFHPITFLTYIERVNSMTYVTKNYSESGDTLAIGGDLNVASGGNLNVKSGGDIEVESGGEVNVASGGKVNVASGGIISAAGTQANHVTDASIDHTVNGTFSNTEVKGHLDALGTKINSILTALEGVGILKTS